MMRVAGVTFEGRQSVLRRLYRDQVQGAPMQVDLHREAGNAFDPNAIQVIVNGYHVGYVPKRLAASLAPRMDAGENVWAPSVLIADGDITSARIVIHTASEEAV